MKNFLVFVGLLVAAACIVTDAQDDVCTQPRQEGTCRAMIPRYYFDAATNECKSFIYGGCRGNDNNFATQADCEAKCRP